MNWRAWIAAVGVLAGSLTPVQAAEVVLTAKAGELTIEGDLLSFDGEFYEVQSDLGTLTVDARTVTCKGEGCPPADALVSRFAVMGDGTAPGLMAALLESYAVTLGAESEQDGSLLRIVGPDGALAEVTLAAGDDFDTALSGDKPVLVLHDGPARDPARARVIAQDALVAVVASTNTLDALTLAQMSQIASGQINNWKEVGGADVPINLHVATGTPGLAAVVAGHGLLSPDGLALATHPRMIDAADAVSTDPFGIAFVSRSSARAAHPLALRGACGIAVAPTSFNVKTGAYPLAYALSVERPALRMPVFAREFADWLATEPAQNVIADFGFAPTGLSGQGIDTQGQRLANAILSVSKDVPLDEVQDMVRMMSGATRLSATFRFRPGSTQLDAPSRAAAVLLADGLILGNYADKIVMLAGFSDADGGAARNKALSAKRAEAARAAIVAAAPDGSLDDVRFEVAGYGEASPLVCEDTPTGAAVNRRVEVWIKDAVSAE